MRKDTFAAMVALLFLAPFTLSILAGYWIDYERDCRNDAECRTGSGGSSKEKCVRGQCQMSQQCGRRATRPSYTPPTASSTGNQRKAREKMNEARREWLDSYRNYQSARREWQRNRGDASLRADMNELRRRYLSNYRRYKRAQSAYSRSRGLRPRYTRRRSRYLYNSGCPSGTSCDRLSGHCIRPSRHFSTLIYFHPGYYPYRARVRRYRSMSRTRGVGGRSRYRSYGRTGRAFRGGGLGFGK